MRQISVAGFDFEVCVTVGSSGGFHYWGLLFRPVYEQKVCGVWLFLLKNNRRTGCFQVIQKTSSRKLELWGGAEGSNTHTLLHVNSRWQEIRQFTALITEPSPSSSSSSTRVCNWSSVNQLHRLNHHSVALRWWWGCSGNFSVIRSRSSRRNYTDVLTAAGPLCRKYTATADKTLQRNANCTSVTHKCLRVRETRLWFAARVWNNHRVYRIKRSASGRGRTSTSSILHRQKCDPTELICPSNELQ